MSEKQKKKKQKNKCNQPSYQHNVKIKFKKKKTQNPAVLKLNYHHLILTPRYLESLKYIYALTTTTQKQQATT
ncbi:hypothetical protein DOY81_005774 [Sarcophaga bullata]|nr:hypothetical protein DOY81_005774 [Sarcophaga bullata]